MGMALQKGHAESLAHFSVVRKAFVECSWWIHISRRKAEIDVVDFYVFDRK